MSDVYLTTTIPYVNARPHLGFALELVQVDVLARHHRRRGDGVWLQTGTDDNSLKNVLAAEAAGVGVREFVDANAEAFLALHRPLSLSFDDVIRTSRDPRHRVGVERFWRACAASGDLYRKHYEGRYCVGCEQFYTDAELTDGRCPEHGTAPQRVAEENWFFRLSRYTDQLRDVIASGRLRIEPEQRRNEVLAFIAGGLADFSISRSTERAHGWGIGVPDDPDQVIYVWWDALGNYLTALGYGTDADDYRRWWLDSDRRIHLVGKGVLRFHAVYWPAMLLSAGLPLPTTIVVHDYLTVEGRKVSKSSGDAADPVALVDDVGVDAVRWWLLREVPRVGDTDVTRDRIAARANDELVNGIGNLVHRVVSMIHRYRAGRPPAGRRAPEDDVLHAACQQASERVDVALAAFDFRQATEAVWRIADEANRYINQVQPWQLARAERDGDNAARHCLDAVLAALSRACLTLSDQLTPFLPDAAALIATRCTPVDGRLPEPRPLFRRIDVVTRPFGAMGEGP